MIDLAVIETENGGDLAKKGNDLGLVNGWANMPYLAMFGGNPGYPSKTQVPTQQNKDWWGNQLFFAATPSLQYNSLTEWTLLNTALTSAGLSTIQKAVMSDLDFMKDFAIVSVSVELISYNKVKIQIIVRQPKDLEGVNPNDYAAIIYVWDKETQTGDFSILDFASIDFFT